VLGVVTMNSTLFGPASMLRAISAVASDSGFAVHVDTVATLDGSSVLQSVQRLLDHGVAGVVVIAPVDTATEALDRLVSEVPLVVLDGDPARSSPTVSVDQAAGARDAVAHLLAAGHGTVWHIAGPSRWFDSAGRIEGWTSALRDAGAAVPPLVTADDWSAASGYRAGQLLARLPEVTAVFAANDHLALGLLRAMSEHGRRVPQDVSVVGFDDVPEAEYFIPPLTTMRPDFDAVAHEGLAVLLDEIQTGIATVERLTIAPELVVRASVGPPPG
jgi:DNA-binding LacI/PurR family transcriptional regulator